MLMGGKINVGVTMVREAKVSVNATSIQMPSGMTKSRHDKPVADFLFLHDYLVDVS
jgi:hypothetical protein